MRGYIQRIFSQLNLANLYEYRNSIPSELHHGTRRYTVENIPKYRLIHIQSRRSANILMRKPTRELGAEQFSHVEGNFGVQVFALTSETFHVIENNMQASSFSDALPVESQDVFSPQNSTCLFLWENDKGQKCEKSRENGKRPRTFSRSARAIFLGLLLEDSLRRALHTIVLCVCAGWLFYIFFALVHTCTDIVQRHIKLDVNAPRCEHVRYILHAILNYEHNLLCNII